MSSKICQDFIQNKLKFAKMYPNFAKKPIQNLTESYPICIKSLFKNVFKICQGKKLSKILKKKYCQN